MAKYPIFLELKGRRAVVIGGGSVAVRKAQHVLDTGARLIVVAERIDKMMTVLCKNTSVELIKSAYTKNYLSEAVIAIAATDDHKLNKRIYEDCQNSGVLCNVVDEPALCDFFVPAIVKRGDLQIAIGTEGLCPAYAGHLRKKLEEIFTEEHGKFLAELEKARKQIISDIPDLTARKTVLGLITDDESFEYFCNNGSDKWMTRTAKIIKDSAVNWK